MIRVINLMMSRLQLSHVSVASIRAPRPVLRLIYRHFRKRLQAIDFTGLWCEQGNRLMLSKLTKFALVHPYFEDGGRP